MKGYIDLILGGLPKTMDGIAVTPATSNLFQTNNNGVPLSEEQKGFYHHVTMQLTIPSMTGMTRHLYGSVIPTNKSKQAR